MQDDPTLAAVKYLVLDEVHERGVDSDFSLALILSGIIVFVKACELSSFT